MSEGEEKKERRQTCTSHCVGCGRHFSGLSSFDAHRRDGQCNDPLTLTYGESSKKRAGDLILQAWTEEGFCDKEIGCWKNGKRDHFVSPVTVWQTAMTDEQREKLEAAFGVDAKQAALL